MLIEGKTKDNSSNSSFKFELEQSVQLPDNCVCYIDDIIIRHSRHTIEDYYNKLYIRKFNSNGNQTDRIIISPTQNHTGATLAGGLDSAYGSGAYTSTYNERRGTITIVNSQSGVTFIRLPDADLSNNFRAHGQEQHMTRPIHIPSMKYR
jgi:hypothetical protein